MSGVGTLYSVRFPYPAIYAMGRDNTTHLEIQRAGARITPTAIAFSLLDPGRTVAHNATPTPSGRTAVVVPASALPTASATYGTGWLEQWLVEMPDGQTYTWNREAIAARHALFPVCSESDLLALYPDLRQRLGTANTQTLQGWLDSGWGDIVRTLARLGKYGHVIQSADGFLDLHRETTLRDFYRYLYGSDPNEAYRALWESHKELADAAWSSVTYRESEDSGSGLPDGDSRTGASAVVHRNVPARRRTSRSPWW